MNDPSAQPIDIEEQRRWLIDHRTATNFSWSELAKRTGIAQGTISQFGGEHGYRGDEKKLAEQVYRYRQGLIAQAQVEVDAPEIPGYFETETSKQLTNLLHYGRRGRVVVAATGAGLGKTKTAKHFRACYPNVFLATMKPSTSGVNTMQQAVLKALGEKHPKGTPQALTERICEMVGNMHDPLLIVDEAQHLGQKAFEEIRGWNDEIGLGIALFGNISVMQRIEGGGRDDAFAQIYSRVALRIVRPLPLHADAIALGEAWGVHDEATLAFLVKITMVPGGLRGATFALELAAMLASSERQPLGLDHLQSAWVQISSRGDR